MLTRSLKELEADGLVRREVFAEVPVRVEYSLTQDGQTLVPILNAMREWGSNRTNR
ncbi:winged helix-turn-helix transcriptional regulator [Pseudophaeobacter sp.]|uniref:winged helix-turn-helix transcriptional regulator n=1 Tax=Pseudophaeobacter sp. TaxID=1971739 RepID=UPI0040584F2D